MVAVYGTVFSRIVVHSLVYETEAIVGACTKNEFKIHFIFTSKKSGRFVYKVYATVEIRIFDTNLIYILHENGRFRAIIVQF